MDEVEAGWENPFVGTWQITWAEHWDQGTAGEESEAPGYFQFDEEDTGEFQFGHINGSIHYRWEISADSATADFTWEGVDEAEPASGRGRVILKGDQMVGKLVIGEEDESKFRAERIEFEEGAEAEG